MSAVQVMTLAQFGQNEPWFNTLVHVQRGGLLLWITRGQGVIHMHGQRRGFSANNAIYIPPQHLWAVDLGRQTLGQAVLLPPALSQSFPTSHFPYGYSLQTIKSREYTYSQAHWRPFETLNCKVIKKQSVC